MGVTTHGFDEWQRILESIPERAPKAFKPVMKRAGVQMRIQWKATWDAIKHPRTHMPHLTKGIGFDDVEENGFDYTVEVGVTSRNRQAFLSKIIEYGTLTSAPHPGGVPALQAEAPRMARAAEKVAADLLE